MTLSFGNMTIELNTFQTSNLPLEMDDHEEVNMIDISVSHIFKESCYEDPLEKYLAHFEQNFDIDESLKEVNALLDSIPVIYTNQWKPQVEPLSLSTFVPVPSNIKPSKLKLKPLSDTLKYAFLCDSEIRL